MINIYEKNHLYFSVVRASGTYFPQNCDNKHQAAPSSMKKSFVLSLKNNAGADDDDVQPEHNDLKPSTSSCQQQFCKLKKKNHQHCELCNQVIMNITNPSRTINHNFCLFFIFILQAFTDDLQMKIHYLKHQSTKPASFGDDEPNILSNPFVAAHAFRGPNAGDSDIPTDLNMLMAAAASKSSMEMLLNHAQNPTVHEQLAAASDSHNQSLYADQFASQMQNLHLAHLASFYQQNPMFYQHLYPLLNGIEQQKLLATQKPEAVAAPNLFAAFGAEGHLALPQKTSRGSAKRKAPTAMLDNNDDESVAMANVAGPAKKMHKGNGSGRSVKNHGSESAETSAAGQPARPSNFRMFKDEPIPQGYLKFRFNEDCSFPSCGYRNHQSHFHCCRNDCYYSFCDKTRFVQHTARHERLDKLMGDDFKQYRANMRCGHSECAYNKNLSEY